MTDLSLRGIRAAVDSPKLFQIIVPSVLVNRLENFTAHSNNGYQLTLKE